MSSIASLQAEKSRLQSIKSELQAELRNIEYHVSSAHDRLERFNQSVCNRLDTSRSLLDDSEVKMEAAVRTQIEIEDLFHRFKAMELANKRIRECNNRKYYDFANYTKVRKLVQGVMDNLDVNMASDRVIYKSVERQHLQTPDYWLTCALLSIMAWRNDDKPLADRAMSIALSLDKKASSIFYMLFNLRMQREEAALKWFQQYQQCEMKGSDQRTFLLLFSLISKCVNSSEELGEHAREEISHFLNRVIEMSVNSAGYNQDEMIRKVLMHLQHFVPNDQPDYPLLRKYSKEYNKYISTLMCAKGNIGILAYFKQIIHVQPEQRNAFIKGFIDELISTANSMEKEVYDEIAYNELIIRMEGDVEAAKEIFGSKKIHDEKEINLIYEMIEWVYGADKEDLNDQSRLNMFTLTRDFHRVAIDSRTSAYRAVDRRHSLVEFDSYSTEMDFEDEQNEMAKVNMHYTRIRDNEFATIKAWPAFVGFGVGAAALIASPFLISVSSTLAGLLAIVGAGAIGFGGIKLLLNKWKRKQIAQNCEQKIRQGSQLIASLSEEYRKFESELYHYDTYVDEIYRELDSI